MPTDNRRPFAMEKHCADALFEMLRPSRLTAIVDIGANAMCQEPPYQRMVDLGICTVIGFEPQPVPLRELNRRKGPHEEYLPYAIGDGTERTLYLCKSRFMSSLLAPDPKQLALFNEFRDFGKVEDEVRVFTRRLDEIDEV